MDLIRETLTKAELFLLALGAVFLALYLSPAEAHGVTPSVAGVAQAQVTGLPPGD